MNKTYCVTDLHGNYKIWKQIQEYLDDSDILYCLGDNNDRGEDGVKIIQEMLDDDRIVYLLGNHECFIINYLFRYRLRDEVTHYKKFDDFDLKIWRTYNGGEPTWKALNQLSRQEQIRMYNNLTALPVYTKYENKNNQIIHLSHSGFSSLQLRNGIKLNNFFSFVENRIHLDEDFWYGKENEFIVHGHSPIQYVCGVQDKIFPLFYCKDHKIDLDVCTIVTNHAILFDLDELEPHYFEDKKGDKNEI